MNPEAKRQSARAMLATLCQRWPKCFDLKNRRPLKIGIVHDLMRELGDPALLRELKAALNLYCGNRAYLSALKAGVPRLDLHGNEVSFVCREDELRAAARLKGLKAAQVEVKEGDVSIGEPNPGPKRHGDSFEGLRRAARERKSRATIKPMRM